MNAVLRLGVLTVLVGMCSSGVLAQEDMPRRGPAAERIAQYKKLRLIETMKLNDDQSTKFFTRYNKHVEEIQDLTQKHSGLVDQIQGLLKQKAADADFEKLNKQVLENEQAIVDARQKFVESLSDIFTAKQIGQYIVFERNFNQHLRELMREIAQQRVARRGP